MAQKHVVGGVGGGGECSVVSRPKETFRWTTPFFDLHFVEIKSKKTTRSPSKRRRSRGSSSASRERRQSPTSCSLGNELLRSKCKPIQAMSRESQQTSSERRMAKYKEERRRQLATQIANRLSSNHSSSSSDDNEDSNSSSLDKYAKYRRHHRSRQAAHNEEVNTPPVAVSRRRRRRSITKESASPASSSVPPVPLAASSAVSSGSKALPCHDADGEDNDLVDREDSPEHIYHQIGTSEVIRVSKANKKPLADNNDSIIITKNSASRKPRFPSKEREPPLQPLQQNEPGDLNRRKLAPSALPTANSEAANATTKKSLLNTSYSSEEILLQAASSLQGLEDEFRNSSQYALKHRGSQASVTKPEDSTLPAAPKAFAKALSSPEMIKSVTRTLTPPISPAHHKVDLAREQQQTRDLARVSPPSSTASNSSSVPISDPFIDVNWPGRPKRNSFGEDVKSLNGGSKRQVSTPSPGTASKPPIFPTSPKIIGNEEMPPFMKEFVLRRQQQQQPSTTENTPTAKRKPTPQIRPQSAFIPSSASAAGSPNARKSADTRRRSDFVSRYESLLNRAQAATKAVDELDLLRLQRAKVDVVSPPSQPLASVAVPPRPPSHNNSDEEEEEEEEVSVDFNEEEVLQRCQDFQKDYEQRKMQQNPPVPKPRQIIGGRPLTSNEQDVPRPSVRMRSSSLTLHDKNEDVNSRESIAKSAIRNIESNQIFPKPILKKSTDDIRAGGEPGRPILKRKDSESSLVTSPNPLNSNTASNAMTASNNSHPVLISQPIATSTTTSTSTTSSGGILKRKSVTDEAAPLTSASSRPDHVRIRSPSPDLDIRPILVRSRNSSLGEEEFPQSILKKRNSQEDLIMDGDISASAGTSGATSRSSPEPPVHGILKRKLSLGNASPDQSIAGAISSILKKSGANSSGQGSLEDLTSGSEGIKSILKKRHTGGSTDDELDHDDQISIGQPPQSHQVMPRSILKSRRSEESLSPLSDDCVAVMASGGCNADGDIKPILKQRDSSRDEGYHSSKLRDKSRSPSRGVTSPPDNSLINEVVFSGSSGVSTPLSNTNRRSSLTFSPKRSISDHVEAAAAAAVVASLASASSASAASTAAVSESPSRKASFVSKTTVFLEPEKRMGLNLDIGNSTATVVDRVKFDSSSLPTSPTSEEVSSLPAASLAAGGGILKRKGSMGSSAAKPKQNSHAVPNVSSSTTPESGDMTSTLSSRRRGVLKKDSSYDDTLRPILKNHVTSTDTVFLTKAKSEEDSSSTSSEDLENLIDANNRGFVDVVIDPMPKEQPESSEDELRVIPSPRKASLGPRPPVIPPSSVKITPDGNLACKLEALSGQAEAKLKQMELEQQQQAQVSSKSTPEKSSNILRRKGSEDLPASEYYAIFKKSSESKNNHEEEVINSNDTEEEETMNKESQMAEVKVQGGGIAERLAALKKNGEENWKKKVPKVEIASSLKKSSFIENNGNDDNDDKNGNDVDEVVMLRHDKKSEQRGPGGKVGSLQERLSQLQSAQSSWQAKVGEKDVSKFTVAGKMGGNKRVSRQESELNAVNEELHKRTRQTPRLRRFQGSPPPANDRSYDEVVSNNEDNDNENVIEILVPEPDEDLDKFFSSKKKEEDNVVHFDLDLDAVVSEDVNNLALLKRNVVKKPVNNRRSKNPVKALANRKDVKQTYQQSDATKVVVMTDEKKEEKNVHSHLAAEAKAALAATEDFSNVQLKKDNKVVPHAEFVPYKAPGETMLLHIKGRRMCQTRLVEPHANSVNSGDAYVALNGTDVIVWQGTFANVIEKSKSVDIGQLIVQRRDLGCKKARRVLLVEEEKVTDANFANKAFWKLLDGGCSAKKAGPPDEDENYELEINDKNLVWNVEEETNELVPVEEYWGHPMKYDLLTFDKRVMVFDFGTEVYVWNGKNAPFSKRRLGLKLAKDMLKAEQRPSWHLFGRINQNMETALFKEKFLNWPDKSRLIKPENERKKSNRNNSNSDETKLSTDVENNFDAIDMARWPLQEPNLELEGTFIGRGRSYYDAAERRQYEIETLSIHFWHVTDKDILELSEKEHGQFFSAATYVVRWKYKVSLTGRDLKGRPSKHVAVGRERWAYFFWQGCDSKAAEQGISALMTVELDEEKGPQIRVEQGQETAVFLNLWKGGMVVHKGRRRTIESSEWKLYFVKGECPEEAAAIEVDCQLESLRSRGAFVLIKGPKAIIWMGRGLPEHKKAVVESLQKRWPHLASVTHLSREAEGQESEAFFSALANRSERFVPDLDVPSASMRLYHMTSVSGEFHVDEMVCPYLSESVPNVMSFNQSDLYKAEQPALFLVEAGDEKLWLWQGWWPDVGHEANDTNMATGSGMIRWHAERREAMRTVKEFQRSKFSRGSKSRPPMELVWAGHEPLEFTNLFPFWSYHEDVKNLNEEYVGNSSLDRVFSLLSRDNYSWEELKQRPLPDGVDPSRLEKYLSDDDFVTHLGLSRADFMAAPRWKQLEIRKEKGLF